MISLKTFRQLALSFAEVTEQPHFEKTSFRVKKKIFVTLDEATHTACVKFSATDQSVYCLIDKTIIWPVPNKWGQQGWTFVDLKKVKKDLLTEVLTTAYCEVAPKALAGLYKKPT
ncbi:MmcQ/YjbR family DNA-binding protein [Lacibacter sp. H407]|uniref:MmcQ/YjbR family DNA-binding protein n=1 Tax=Lacibacter sp. H407 TaxID=3133423 RepID=UPI0030C26A6B